MSSRPPERRRAPLATLALLALATAAEAQFAPAARFNRAEITVHTSSAVDRVVGWEFTATSTFQATALGVFDCELSFAPQGGLARPKAVGLWDLNQNLLAAATVPAGQGGALCQDGFRYVSIPATTLQAGQGYVIGSFWQQDDGTGSFDDYPDPQNSGNPVWFAPGVQFVQPRYRLGVSGLAYPSSALPGLKSFLGAVNFRIGAGAPDPNPPADLATTFASNNAYAGNMFDLRALHPQGLTVDAFQVNVGDVVPQSAPVRVSVYWRYGSYTQATDASAGWQHLGTAQVPSWGLNQPTPVPIGGLALPPNQTIGVYVLLTDYTQHPPASGVPLMGYTSVGPAASSYGDGSLLLTGGVGKGAPPFTGETFPSRMWNGGILYSVGASPYDGYCFGDGSGAPCPCGNPGAPGEGCANGAGSGALLAAQGGASVGAGATVLTGAGLPPGRSAIFFQADDAVGAGAGHAFGDGLRCAAGEARRLQLRTAGPDGAAATTVDLAAAGDVSPGETKRYQIWYRDPLGSPCGAGFNLSQGLEIRWSP